MLVEVACRSLGIGTKVYSPEDPVAQKERTREEERQKNVPGTAEAGARHREYSTVHHVLVLRGVLLALLLTAKVFQHNRVSLRRLLCDYSDQKARKSTTTGGPGRYGSPETI